MTVEDGKGMTRIRVFYSAVSRTSCSERVNCSISEEDIPE
jgi:hypothetical protein